MPGYPCCCPGPCCCPHCDPCTPRTSYEFTTAAPDFEMGSDCCDDQAACNQFSGTFTLDYMGNYDACVEEDYTPCGFWQSEVFSVGCDDDGTNPHDCIVVLAVFYRPSSDACIFIMAFAAARILENLPCNISELCRPDCVDDAELMYAVYQNTFTEPLDCTSVILNNSCFGNYCTNWPASITISKP